MFLNLNFIKGPIATSTQGKNVQLPVHSFSGNVIRAPWQTGGTNATPHTNSYGMVQTASGIGTIAPGSPSRTYEGTAY